MSGKRLDVIVFGATGDTGRSACHFLFNKAKTIDIKSWAPAARNLKKLNKLVGDVIDTNASAPENGVAASPAIQADSNDYESLVAMAKQAKVVVAMAGPFLDYGEGVVKACVEANTHYIDITGETPWVNVMAKKYGDDAMEKGLYMLSQAAYDSVPSDITVALAALALKEKGETVAAVETHHHIVGGALPVGTLKTMLNGVMHGRSMMLRSMTGGLLGAPSAQDAEKKKADRKSLKGKAGLVPKSVEKSIARDFASNNKNPKSTISGAWSLPSIMTVVNTPIVWTTAESLGYANKHFTYRERNGLDNAGAASLYGFLPVAATMAGLTVGALVALPFLIPMVLLFPQAVSNAAENFNNSDPGNMKAKAFKKLFNGFRPNGLTKVKAIASSVSGKSFAQVDFESDYEAGLGFTVVSALTVASAILHKAEQGEEGHGFETAVVAAGPENLQEWYGKAGVRINVKPVRAKL